MEQQETTDMTVPSVDQRPESSSLVGERRAPRRSFGDGGERREGFEVILRRFFRDVQQSGILTEVKRRRFHTKPLSRSKKREIATRKAARRRLKRGY